jgi:16S rRNA (cytosine967-C5)-methyltransferase
MHPALRPAPSAVIRMCRGSSAPAQLLEHALALTRSGGTLIYCTCSLEPEENEEVVAALLARNGGVRRVPITASEVLGRAEFISPDGDLRTLPCQLPDPDSRLAGLDGFYAARLEKL